MKPLYHLRDVRYSYLGRFPALEIEELKIQHPSRVALIGANGSGKSTLLKILDALYFAQAGSVEFDGNRLTENEFQTDSFALQFRRRVGLLFQDPEAQLFSPTVLDEICFGPLQLRWDKKLIREKSEEILGQFGLMPLRDRPPYRLSLGEKKKVALASVLIVDPDVLLLDEPTAALDPRTQSMLLELLHEWGQRDKTIITSTHDLSILREISDEIFVLQEGRIVFHGSSESVLTNQPLLESTNLIHVHTHQHRELTHAHPHLHDFHAHDHDSKGADEHHTGPERPDVQGSEDPTAHE